MVYVRDCQMREKNRHGIGEDQIFTPVKDSLLAFGEVLQAKKTLPFLYISFSHIGHAALDSTGIVLEANGKSIAGDISLPDFFKQFVTLSKILPRLFLLRQELVAKSWESL
jgi:hypothetical protein